MQTNNENVIPRAYYFSDAKTFISTSEEVIYHALVHNSLQFDLTAQQETAWTEEIRILKTVMRGLSDDDYIAMEYTIPRMGKRIDSVIFCNNHVFLVEFKVFETSYSKHASDQVLDYALDLHNFHELSHEIALFPILVCTNAHDAANHITIRDGVASVTYCNAESLLSEVHALVQAFPISASINAKCWINAPYKPTPTIIEAAQALYSGHAVREISHKESDENDIEATTKCINDIIEESKSNGRKSICFVTGVPGAGKTLVGLNIANLRHRFSVEDEEHAVFLSGNEPLVTVLREALTRDQNEKRNEKCLSCKKDKRFRSCDGCENNRRKADIFAETKSFIQMVHWFRDDSLTEGHPAPVDKIAIFDEAQRAWKKEQLSKFMRTKKGQPNFNMSEPECLIEYMNRHAGWAVIVCLVGGGQEIHDGEAGITEWFSALNTVFPNWRVYCSNRITDSEYVGDSSLSELLSNVDVKTCRELHLSVSMRSFRSELVSAFAKAVIDGERQYASELYKAISQVEPATGSVRYPVVLTRNLESAKAWVKSISRGTERYGIIASSGAKRLRADGITVSKDIDVVKWFLNDSSDVDSSFFMEVAASEFKIQGLEIDYAVMAWEGDYRYSDGDGLFTCNKFEGSAWKTIRSAIEKKYLKNSYRVLLTRARQGFVIYVPQGCENDPTRLPQYYDGTFDYLKSIGIKEI